MDNSLVARNREKLQQSTKSNSHHRNSYWFENYWIWRWERHTRWPPTLTPAVGCYPNFPHKGSTSQKKWKTSCYTPPYRQVGRYSAQCSPTVILSWTWMKRSAKSRDPEHRVFFELLERNEGHSLTQQRARLQTRGNQGNPHTAAKWQHHHPAPSPSRTRTKKESGLHRHASRRRV